MYVYMYVEVGVQKLHLYSSFILSWVYNHQALFKPQGGVSTPSCAPLQKIKRVLHAHRHIGPSNPYVQKILCLFIYLFRGFFLMGTSITIRREMSSRVIFLCEKKEGLKLRMFQHPTELLKINKAISCQSFQQNTGQKKHRDWKPLKTQKQTHAKHLKNNSLHLCCTFWWGQVFLLFCFCV